MSGKFRPLVRDDSEYFRIFDDSNSDDDERDTDLETLLGKQSPSKWKWYDFFSFFATESFSRIERG